VNVVNLGEIPYEPRQAVSAGVALSYVEETETTQEFCREPAAILSSTQSCQDVSALALAFNDQHPSQTGSAVQARNEQSRYAGRDQRKRSVDQLTLMQTAMSLGPSMQAIFGREKRTNHLSWFPPTQQKATNAFYFVLVAKNDCNLGIDCREGKRESGNAQMFKSQSTNCLFFRRLFVCIYLLEHIP
jgi:hypothetical protein